MRIGIRGDLLDFTAAPAWGDVDSPAVRFRPNHWLLIDDEGRIAGAQVEPPPEGWQRIDHTGRLVLPGFIDTHVHSPQIDVIASYGNELLDWLTTHTFPAEAKHRDALHTGEAASHFLDALLAHGTTAAVVFPTVHASSAEALFAEGEVRGMRLISGKVLMDRNAPPDLVDTVEAAERETTELVERWHRRGRLAYALTVRFAVTSTPAQLAMAGRFCRADDSLYMQTHLAENQAEVAWVKQLFPEARSYLDVYAQAGLLHSRSVFAHGIWLDDADRAALATAGAQIAHSPSSNLFLGSGLFGWRAAEAAGVHVSLASDVGGGTSLSMLRNMAEAYKIQALQGERLTAWKALHAATRGAATALGLQHEIGSLEPRRMADVCIWDAASGPVATRRAGVARTLHERVFAWMTLADERNLVEAFVAGRSLYRRDASLRSE